VLLQASLRLSVCGCDVPEGYDWRWIVSAFFGS
jgi:hypothetical protein